MTMQRPQLALLRVQSRPEDVNFGVNHARLVPQPPGYAAVADEAGLLRYLKLDNRAFNTESVYQLQYGSELVYQSREPIEVPCMIDRPWTAFEFIPYTARAILFHQSGSNKLLYTTLPDATTASSPVLLFGCHTGLISCFSVSAAGRHVVSGSAVGAIKLWSLREGIQLDMQEAGHPAGVSALAFLEPAVVLSGGAQGGVCIWEVHQQKLLARQCLDAGPTAVGSLTGLQPTSVNQTSMLDEQRAMPWQEALAAPAEQAEAVYVVAGTDAGMLHVWAASGTGQKTWQPVANPQQGKGHAVKALSFSPDGSLLAVAAGTGIGHIWLYNTKDWSCRRMEGGLIQPPLACCFCDWGPLSHQAAHLFVAPGPTAAAQCLPVPTVTKPPVPPYLHYQDPADEEDSCPQPSALPAALAASLPATHQARAAGHHHFHSHPPLPPHPLLKLHRSAVDSPTRRAHSPRHVASSLSHGHFGPEAHSCSPSRPAGSGPSCKGPGASSLGGTAQADNPSGSPHASDVASVPSAPVLQSSDQQQLQQHKPQRTDLLQQQQHEVMSAQLSGNGDGPRQVASTPETGQDEANVNTEEQENSDSDSEGSELSDCCSAGAVGDDELLDHEPAITDSAAETQQLPVDQPGHNSQLRIGRHHDWSPLCSHTAKQECVGSIPRPPGHSSMVTQHQIECSRAIPQHLGNQAVGQQQRAAAHPQQWPFQAMVPIVRRGQVQHGLGRGSREVHVIHEASKLRAAYRGDCQQGDQRQSEAEQQLAQHGRRQDSGANGQSQLQAVQVAEEVASQAADEEADQQRECFAQPYMEAVAQPMPASHIPVKMKVPKQLYVRPLAPADQLTDQPAFHSRTAAGQFWTAGGQHPRSPLCDLQPTAAAPVPALAQPQANSSALLAAKIDRLQGEEFDAAAVLQDPHVQKRVASAAAVAANVPRDAHLYHGLQSLHEVVVPMQAPKLVPKQLHPAWVAKQHLKPELADLWTAQEQYRAVLTTKVLPRHVKLSRERVAESLLRFCS